MKRTVWLQETKQMRFEEAYSGWTERRLTQEDAAQLLGVCARTFRRYIDRYEEDGLDGLLDKRLTQLSHRRAPVDEVLRLVDRYRRRHDGWNVKHYYSWYRRDGGQRSYSWVKNTLQAARVVKKATKRGAHRKRREPAPWPGMLLHQDGSDHEWVPGRHWDLIVTMDDATNEHYSMFFCEEEGTQSSFQGVREVIEAKGLFCSLYTDRASHYWHTPEAGGKVDKVNLTQFGRAMRQLGVEMIPAYSPEARGRSERGPLARTRGVYRRNWLRPASRTGTSPMRMYGMSTCRRSMRSLPIRPGRTARPSCRTRPRWSWTTSCVSRHNGPWARTTVCVLTALYYRSRQTGTGITTSRPR